MSLSFRSYVYDFCVEQEEEEESKMNPIHAACFNELKELCRKYEMSMYADGDYINFNFKDTYELPLRINCYYNNSFNKETDSFLQQTGIKLPPPEAIGGDGND